MRQQIAVQTTSPLEPGPESRHVVTVRLADAPMPADDAPVFETPDASLASEVASFVNGVLTWASEHACRPTV